MHAVDFMGGSDMGMVYFWRLLHNIGLNLFDCPSLACVSQRVVDYRRVCLTLDVAS